jgi:hypothetical protein
MFLVVQELCFFAAGPKYPKNGGKRRWFYFNALTVSSSIKLDACGQRKC